MAIYRTAQGKSIDMNALILKNGSTRAVGNMGINAKGDIVDGNNSPVKKRKDRIQKQYNRQVQAAPTSIRSNVSDGEVQETAAPPKTERRKSQQVKKPKTETSAAAKVQEATPAATTAATPAPAPAAAPKTGLGAAIARAREIRKDGSDGTTRSGITKI